MQIQCYSIYSDIETRDRVFQLCCGTGGWYSDCLSHARVYICEDYVTVLLLIDPTARRLRKEDYIL